MLKKGEYKVKGYKTSLFNENDQTPFAEIDGVEWYKLYNLANQEIYVPLDRIITEEDGGGDSGYDSNTDIPSTDKVGAHWKAIKKKKKGKEKIVARRKEIK